MALPTVWSKDPHTDAKHRILEEYLKAWYPILSKRHRRMVYIDGFAGPGIYDKGQLGSPIIAIKCLLDHTLKLDDRDTEFIFLFVESDKQRAKTLDDVIKDKFPEIPKNIKIFIKHGTFGSTMEELLDKLEEKQKNIAPTFAFIDPFGYGGLPLYLIQRILAFPHCEVFINFAYDSINRFTETKDGREGSFDELFGSDQWREVREIRDSIKRNDSLTALYTKQLQKSAKYVRSFEMVNSINKISYYLFFATNHILGFEQMKTAMWKVDPRGGFRFADTTDVGTRFIISFIEGYKFQEQAKFLYSHFRGNTVSKNQIKLFCIEKSPFPTLWSTSLKNLEQERKITVITERKRTGTFPEGCIIAFNP